MLFKSRVGSNVNYSINFCQQRGSTSYLAPRVFCEVVSAFLWPKKLRDRQCDQGNGVEQCTYGYDWDQFNLSNTPKNMIRFSMYVAVNVLNFIRT